MSPWRDEESRGSDLLSSALDRTYPSRAVACRGMIAPSFLPMASRLLRPLTGKLVPDPPPVEVPAPDRILIYGIGKPLPEYNLLPR
jgi:hypothetical protein